MTLAGFKHGATSPTEESVSKYHDKVVLTKTRGSFPRVAGGGWRVAGDKITLRKFQKATGYLIFLLIPERDWLSAARFVIVIGSRGKQFRK